MTKREKTLGSVFGGLFVAIVGTTIVMGGVRKISDMRAQSSRMTEKIEELESVIETRALWEQRSSWVDENLPTFETRGRASSELISRVDAVSKQHGVTIDTKELIEAPTEEELEMEGGFYDSAGLKIEISGNEESVVKWIHSLQQPNKFIGVSRLKIEPDEDSGILNGEAEVRLWYGGEQF